MTTLVIDDSCVGVVLPGPGAITKIELTALPNDRWGFAAGPLTLVDNGGPNPRQIYNIDADHIGRMMGLSISQSRFWFGSTPVMSATPIPFGSLLIQAVPRGSAFQLEVQ
jgi:hypothetical protein